MKKVYDMEESVFIDFLNGIHGKALLDSFDRRNGSIYIERRSDKKLYGGNSYIFSNRVGCSDYVVVWQDENKQCHYLSSEFTAYMNPSSTASGNASEIDEFESEM